MITPQIMPGSEEEMPIAPYPSFTYRHVDDRMIGNVDGIAAVRQAIWHIIQTERYAFAIYPPTYGIEIEQYIGREMSFLRASIEDTLNDALTQDDRITKAEVTDVRDGGKNGSAHVTFVAYTAFGNVEMEMDVRV